MHERVEEPDPVILVGDRVHAVLFVVRMTTPPKLSSAFTVTVEVPTETASTGTLVGLALTLKSWTV